MPALALTGSRGAWLAGAFGVAVAAAVHLRQTARCGDDARARAQRSSPIFLIAPPPGTGDRSAYWQVARAEIAAQPVRGTGAGTYHVYAAEHPAGPAARDAHSLYLQIFGELGAVGLVLVLSLVGLPLVAGLRANAAIVGGFATFALHAAADWDWQMPAVTVAGLALGAALVRQIRR